MYSAISEGDIVYRYGRGSRSRCRLLLILLSGGFFFTVSGKNRLAHEVVKTGSGVFLAVLSDKGFFQLLANEPSVIAFAAPAAAIGENILCLETVNFDCDKLGFVLPCSVFHEGAVDCKADVAAGRFVRLCDFVERLWVCYDGANDGRLYCSVHVCV